jgi:hypothetical protein
VIAAYSGVVRVQVQMEDCVEEVMGNRITLRQAMLKILKQAGSTENAGDSRLPHNGENLSNTNSSEHLSDSRGPANKGIIKWSSVLNHILFRSSQHRFVMMKLK